MWGGGEPGLRLRTHGLAQKSSDFSSHYMCMHLYFYWACELYPELKCKKLLLVLGVLKVKMLSETINRLLFCGIVIKIRGRTCLVLKSSLPHTHTHTLKKWKKGYIMMSMFLQVLRDSLTVSSFSQGSRPLRLSKGEELGDELCLIRQVFLMYDHRREGTLTVQEVKII